MVADVTAREVGVIDLSEALELTALIALRDRPRASRFAIRWLEPYLSEGGSIRIEDAAFIANCLAALGGSRHAEALSALRALVRAR
jgi:hypothetical protein